MRGAAAAAAILALIAAGLMIFAFVESRRDPLVRLASLTLPNWPADARPLSIVLLSDLHLGNRSTDRARLRRVVDQVNGLHPDLVLIAGDFIAGHKPIGEARALSLLRPLAQLRPPLGTVGVLGNHDYWAGADAVRSALKTLGVEVLMNDAVQRGPIALGGVDDGFTRHDEVGRVAAAVRAMAGGRIILTHSPEIVSKLPDDFPLLLAGHTHCGQVRLPWIGSVDLTLRYGRYECGLIHDPGRVTVVTAGVGTSVAPLRLGAPPDLWLLTVGPASGQAPVAATSSPAVQAVPAPQTP